MNLYVKSIGVGIVLPKDPASELLEFLKGYNGSANLLGEYRVVVQESGNLALRGHYKQNADKPLAVKECEEQFCLLNKKIGYPVNFARATIEYSNNTKVSGDVIGWV